MKILQKKFGEVNGHPVTSTTLINDQGMEVASIDYGCIITKVIVPDKNGQKENVVLGFESIDEYMKHSPYFGAVVGRFAGRIKGGSFELDGQSYQLEKNNMGNHLHGGLKGFDKVIWNSQVITGENETSIIYTYLSRDGEEGYPGNLEVNVKYTLSNTNEFSIFYEAVSDKKTLVNVTNHSYFNLSGNLKRDILDHQLTLKSESFLELDEELIPTGEILSVKGTPFDFRESRNIKDGSESGHVQKILTGKGYDHPFLLADNHNQEIVLKDSESGRVLTIETDQPGVVLYTGTQLSSDFKIRGVKSRKYLGLCLETQGLPDSIHHPHFPSSILDKNEVFRSTTKYIFSVIT
ncbi:aldose epimerase family protein [Fictibacillus barbaricus]|uniref:Aldose 1-epimerase n=1 Tax=Fictibacillus barbaricus TaxID=182136 RepID=A0ABS2ZEE9_9BACL|nr:aldose epimerase family protein [Fictibacillus barbaricus]MBN3546550.1 galactose mutarotase [Fictibacillus barbaricus]GGB41906.1 aldose 1-epimerase [Fictibacillus barbaricus]